MPEDAGAFESGPGCLPRVLRRLFGRPLHYHDEPTELDGEDISDARQEERDFESSAGCLPRVLRRLFGPRGHLDEDLDEVDELEDRGEIGERTAGCLRLAVLITGICVFTILGFLGIDIDDSTTMRTVALTEEPAPSGTDGTPAVASWAGGYVHGANKFKTPSKEQACAVLTHVAAGDTVTFSGSGSEGAVTATGTVGAGGRVLAEGGISQLGPKTFTSGEVTHSGTNAQEPLTVPTPLSIDVQGGTSKPCDPSTLPAAPSGTPATKATTTKTVTTTTNGFPWSLVTAGGLDLTLLGLFLGLQRAAHEITPPEIDLVPDIRDAFHDDPAAADQDTGPEYDPNENAWGGPADGPDRDEN